MDHGKPPESKPLVEATQGEETGSQAIHYRDLTAPRGPETAPDRIALLQQAFLLEQLSKQETGSKAVGELNKKIGAVALRELQLSPKVANKVRQELAEQKKLVKHKNGGKVSYELTEAGRAYLATLERPTLSGQTKLPILVDETAIPDEVRDAQKAFLLLQLLDADGQSLTRGEANKFRDRLRISLGFKTTAIANYRRAKLAEQGYIQIKRVGGSEQYVLTPDGQDYLAAGARHLEYGEFTLKGKTLNVLVAKARESSFERDRPAGSAVAAQTLPSQAELTKAVLAEFQELRRESHGRSGLVPVHELRQRIADRFGAAAARHDTLDEVVLELWRQDRLGLLAISDLSDATEQQLTDSIQGVNGTLFYLEVAREQPIVAEPIQR